MDLSDSAIDSAQHTIRANDDAAQRTIRTNSSATAMTDSETSSSSNNSMEDVKTNSLPIVLHGRQADPLFSSLEMTPTLGWLWQHFAASPSSPSLIAGSSSAPSTPGPSAALLAVFANHKPDPTGAIAAMVRKMCAKILPPPATTAASASVTLDHRVSMAMKLYYSMLENIASSETNRILKQHESLQAQRLASFQAPLPPPVIQFNIWLGSRTFHASLLSVAFEVVFYAHATQATYLTLCTHTPSDFSCAPHYHFPYCLNQLELSSWDFLKHLEVAVKSLPSLLPGGKGSSSSPPSLLKQYLKRLENECLLWRIWVKDSPLLRILDNERTASIATAAAAAAAAAAVQQQAGAQFVESEHKASPPSSAPSSGSSTNSNSSSNTKTLDIFQRQLFSLAAEHLSILCGPSSLNLGNLLLEGCWELLKEIVIEHTNLLHNRHLDSILLCIVYNIAVKVAPLAFAEAGVSPQAAGVAAAGSGLVGQQQQQSGTASANNGPPPSLDFKKIIAAYMVRWEHNHAQVIRDVSTFHASSQPITQPTPTTTNTHDPSPSPPSAPSSSGSTVPVSSVSSATTVDVSLPTSVNVINFYNKYFIHEIKQYSKEFIQPKLMETIDNLKPISQRKNKNNNNTTTTASGAVPGKIPATSTNSPLPLAPSTPYRSSHPGASLLSPGSYSPLRGARDFSHRSHPYHLTPHASVALGGSLIYPAGSIHAYLSPRKAQVASSNIYMSRLTASSSTSSSSSAPQQSQSIPPRPPVSLANGSTLSSYTPTKGKLGLGMPRGAAGVAERMAASTTVKEEEAMAALSSMPATPLPQQSGIPQQSRYNSAPSATGPLTPLTSSMYAFGESPSSVLDEINRSVAASANAHSSSRRVNPSPHPANSFASPAGRPESYRPTAGGSGSSAGGGSGRKAALRRDLFSAAT